VIADSPSISEAFLFLGFSFSSTTTYLPTCFNLSPTHVAIPLHHVMTGPSSFRLCNAANFAFCSSSLIFSASSHLFRLLAFSFSILAASASLSSCVFSGRFCASFLFAAFSIFSSCFSRRFSRSTICAYNCSLLFLVVLRSDARIGASSAVGIHEARSDFFFGRGGVFFGAVGSILTFLAWNALGRCSFAFRFFAMRSARASCCNAFSPSSSSAPAAAGPLSSSSSEESIWTSEPSSSSTSKPASSSSSANRSSRSSSSASCWISDVSRFPAVERFARLVASHSFCSSSSSVPLLSESDELSSPSSVLIGVSMSSSSAILEWKRRVSWMMK